MRTAAEQFRLTQLEARFNSYSELNHRRLRDREEGRSTRAAAAPGPRAAYDAKSGIVITDRLESDAVGALYDALAREQNGAPSMALDAFRGYIAKQVESIRLKTGAEAVQFRLAAEEGKIKLKARPVGSAG